MQGGWITAVHEAAHAVVYATAGRGVKWVGLRGRDSGRLSGDASGGCELEPLGFVPPCGWHTGHNTWWAKRDRWKEMMDAAEDPQAMTHALRAELCGLLAGPLSELRLEGKADGPLPSSKGKTDDFSLAGGYAALLGDADAMGSHYATATLDLLSEQETWARVLSLAVALQQRGSLAGSDLAVYLPKRREGWPG